MSSAALVPVQFQHRFPRPAPSRVVWLRLPVRPTSCSVTSVYCKQLRGTNNDKPALWVTDGPETSQLTAVNTQPGPILPGNKTPQQPPAWRVEIYRRSLPRVMDANLKKMMGNKLNCPKFPHKYLIPLFPFCHSSISSAPNGGRRLLQELVPAFIKQEAGIHGSCSHPGAHCLHLTLFRISN